MKPDMEKVRSLYPPRPHRKRDRTLRPPKTKPIKVALITLPDEIDFSYWCEYITTADEKALENEKRSGKSALDLSVEWPRVHIAYPHAEGIRDVKYIYVAYRGMVRFRHRASVLSVVDAASVAEMADIWQGAMQPGKRYLYCLAAPEQTPPLLTPPIPLWRHVYGHVLTDDPFEIPVWL